MHEITNRLHTDWGYELDQAKAVTSKLLDMDGALFTAFETWISTGILPESPTYAGLSPRSAAAAYPQLKEPAIFLVLDWIRREPAVALGALDKEYPQ